MRKYLHIDLSDKSVREETRSGDDLAIAGRYFIAKTLVDMKVGPVDPLGPENPLIFSVGPFAGSNWSNANRTSVGCKSPLTGGVKESNAGGSFGLALGHLSIAGFTLNNAANDWVIIVMRTDGSISFEDASDYMGTDNFECASKLHEKYGNKVSLAICGPVGEYGGLIAGIAMSDTDQRPTRMAARGGVGAVMGSKKVKAIVAELSSMPTFKDRQKVIKGVREYNKKLSEDGLITAFKEYGTAMVTDLTNETGGLPVNNFTAGRLVDTNEETLKMGGTYIRELNLSRGGQTAHACMPGCMIECSNVYVGADGEEIASPIEYETLGLMGTNCGIKDPDDLARLNNIANSLGVDTIETGAMMGVLLDSGLAEFGDVAFLTSVLNEIGKASENGKLWAQGTARVGAHYKMARTPVIKKQGISAYDPRVVEVTGISMMLTAQGADHTTGNSPGYDCVGKDLKELVDVSMGLQVQCAAEDSLGLCIFGGGITNANLQLMVDSINGSLGTSLEPSFFHKVGCETLKYEDEFNKAAGFTEDDDELPEFFYKEALPPTNRSARFHAAEVNEAKRQWWNENAV
jgi:aldehyde:ferredoxin oxidoreductase